MTDSAHPGGHKNKLLARMWDTFTLVEPAPCAHAPQDGGVAAGYCLVRWILQAWLGRASGGTPFVVLHGDIVTDGETVLGDARIVGYITLF